MELFKTMNKKNISYLGLFFVVFVWGCSPLLTLELYKYYSPTARLVFSEIVLLISYIAISGKHLKEFNWDYIKIGIPTGSFMALANMSQKIGLMYTTPAKYAFLENLTCVSVPVLMYILVKKKPSVSTILSCLTCLASVIVLNGTSSGESSSWGIGEILCALAGLLYGFNIAGTSVYARKLYPPLYLAAQAVVALIIYAAAAVLFDKISLSSSGVPIEPIMFSFKIEHLLYVIVISVVTSALCWVIRTNAMKHIDASAVAIIMPFSAVVTSIASIIMGNDTLNINVVLGGILGMLAIFLSAYTDIFKKKKCQ